MHATRKAQSRAGRKCVSIKQYIVFTFIFLVVTPTLIAFYLIIRSYGMHTVQQNISQKVDLLGAIYQNIHGQLQNFRDMTMLLYYDDALMESLQQPDADPKQSETCCRLLGSMVNSEKYLSAAVITTPGGVCTRGQTYQGFDVFAKQYEKQIYAAKGRPVWLATHNLVTTYGMKTQAFVVARAINSPNQSVGILWLCISETLLYHNLKDYYQSGESKLYIIDETNTIITSTDREAVTQQATVDALHCTSRQYKGATVYEDESDDGNILIVRNIPQMNWRLVDATPKRVIYGQLRNIQKLGILVFGMYLLFIFVTYFALSRMVFQPLLHLRKGLVSASHGDFTEKVEKKRNDEIGELTDSYSTMLHKIDELMHAVREEEQAKTEQRIKVLAMQIGPHFVYNTLNSIKWMASINKQTNIKRMVECLIQLMMSVTYNTNEEIPLRDELQLLESYCYIQKARYVNFELVCQVPESLLAYKVNKLILQPIVENSILYGFCQAARQGTITVSASKTQDSLLITVEDDGQGFDTIHLDDILNKEQTDSQHIGLKNVNERIRLSHGEPYGLTLESCVGSGTRVHLRLPLL